MSNILSGCEIFGVFDGLTIVQAIPMNTADSIVTIMNIPQIMECFCPSSVNFEIRVFLHVIIHIKYFVELLSRLVG